MNLDLRNMTPEELRARLEIINTLVKEKDMKFEIDRFKKIIEHWADIDGISLEDAATKAKAEAFNLARRSTNRTFSIPTHSQFVTAILERRAMS